MNEHTWLTTPHRSWMLGWMQEEMSGAGYHPSTCPHPVRVTDRKLRLFAVACCRAVWEQLTDPRSRRAVEVAERYADGLATEEERRQAMRSLPDARSPDFVSVSQLVINCLFPDFWKQSEVVIELVTNAYKLPSATQASLLRCIVGNPFRPVQVWRNEDRPGLGPIGDWQTDWITPTVLVVAQTIYDENRWQDTPILADALEDAGCANADILDHLRGDGPHARGCHVVDAILGKELHRD